MEYTTDKQTLDDLNIHGKYKPNTIFSIFNHVKTGGGEKLLEKMFKEPLTDHEAINQRSQTFAYFQERKLNFPFQKETFDIMERFLLSGGSRSLLTVFIHSTRRTFLKTLGVRQEYDAFKEGFDTSIRLLSEFYTLLKELHKEGNANPYSVEIALLFEKFSTQRFQQLLNEHTQKKPSLLNITYADHLLRDNHQTNLATMFELIYKLDVCIAVSDIARNRNFNYAHALPKEEAMFNAEGLFHPALEKPITNDILLNKKNNVIFLTGANMAGKSTFMKSVGIAGYLAHMGFPIAAKKLQFSVKDGLFSSINVSDNLEMGHSHFYAEVLRVKKVAEQVASGKKLVVLFDELFKGTNVKDAYDATLAVTKELSEYSNCFFIISTHIIEVGEELKPLSNIQFRYLPTVMEGNAPRYTYRVQEGITADRQGMIIIENEKILEMLA